MSEEIKCPHCHSKNVEMVEFVDSELSPSSYFEMNLYDCHSKRCAKSFHVEENYDLKDIMFFNEHRKPLSSIYTEGEDYHVCPYCGSEETIWEDDTYDFSDKRDECTVEMERYCPECSRTFYAVMELKLSERNYADGLGISMKSPNSKPRLFSRGKRK